MKKLLLSASLASILGMSGCGSDETLDEIREQTPVERPFARVVFDPGALEPRLNIPNDLLMLPNTSLFDFTIETEGQPFDAANPEAALGAIDGWSRQHPFTIQIDLPAGVDIDPNSVSSGIRIFESTQALLGTSAACQTLAAEVGAPGIPCELGDELQFGVDFIAQYAGGGIIQVVPLRQMKAAQGHMLVVSDQLTDLDGRAVRGSTTWDSASQDISTLPLGSQEQLQLQTVVNSLVNVLAPAGLSSENVAYAAYFTTQSTGTVMSTVKQLQIAPFAQAFAGALGQGLDPASATQFAGQFLPAIVTSLPESGLNAYEALVPRPEFASNPLAAFGTCDNYFAALADPSNPFFAAAQEALTFVAPACATDRVLGSVNLPFYLDPQNPRSEWMRAACTNGVMLSALGEETVGALLAQGAVGPNNDLCQLLPTPLLDLNLAAIGIQDERHLTRFSPVPAARGSNADNPATLYNEAGTETLGVQFTVPNLAVIEQLSLLSGGAISAPTMPEGGWPIVIFQHGLGGSKENALLLAGTFALAGYATVAIDQPLHGERAMIGPDGELVSASLDPSVFLSLDNLLKGRDNTRQGSADILGLRLALNAIVDTTASLNLNPANVHFIGQSLGTVTGTSGVANAATSLGGDLAAFDGMYDLQSIVLNVPASGISLSLLESAAFRGVAAGGVLAGGLPEFAAFVGEYAVTNQLPVEQALAPALDAFLAQADAAQLAAVDGVLSSFAFAGQTVIDDADPVSYAQTLAASGAPTLVQLVVGGGTNDDGSTAVTDQVNPVTTSLPLYGALPFTQLAGLPQVSTTTTGSGFVSFIAGGHGSLLSPAPSIATTVEMQTQAISFFATGNIVVNNPEVVAN